MKIKCLYFFLHKVPLISCLFLLLVGVKYVEWKVATDHTLDLIIIVNLTFTGLLFGQPIVDFPMNNNTNIY